MEILKLKASEKERKKIIKIKNFTKTERSTDLSVDLNNPNKIIYVSIQVF